MNAARLAVGLSLLVVLALDVSPARVSAHAEPVRSQPVKNGILPAAPAIVQIWFDEALTSSGSTINVYDAQRHEVDRGDSQVDLHDAKHLTVSLRPGLPNGTYTVAWTSISADDGHIVHGTFAFTVGLGTLPGASATNQGIPSPAAIAASGLIFLGLMVPAGWFLLALLGLPPEVPRRRVPAIAALVALAADLALAPIEAYLPGPGLPRQAVTNVVAELPGAWHWRLVAEVGTLALVLSFPWWRCRTVGRRILPALGAVLVGAAVLGLAFSSHAAARTSLRALALGAESLHLETVAFWLGGVVVLAAVPGDCRTEHAASLRRFSRLAFVVAPLAVLSGAGLATLTFPSLASLWTSSYGRILLVKAGFVVLVFAFAGINHRAVAQGLRRAVAFGRSLRAEVAFGTLAILTAATMSLWAPPLPKQIQPLQLRLQAGQQLVAHVTISPVDDRQPNRIDAWLTDAQNQPVSGVTRVTADLTMLERAVEQPNLTLTEQPGGHWVANNVHLEVRGWWELQVHFQGPHLAEATGDTVFIVPDPLLVGPPPSRASEPAAKQLFDAALTRLGQLTSMREVQDLSDGVGDSITTQMAYEAPDRFSYQTGAGDSSVSIGDTQYFRSGNGPWTSQQRPDQFQFPATLLTYYSGSTEFTLGRQQVLDGELCQVLTFYTPPNASRGKAWYAWWVGTQTHLIRREAMVADHHYMLVHYTDFDAPIQITAPALGPGTPSASPPAGVTAQPPADVAGVGQGEQTCADDHMARFAGRVACPVVFR